MKILSVLTLLFSLVSLSPATFAKLTVATTADNILYIQSTKANILDNPSFGGTSIAKIFKGSPVEVVTTKPNWVKVRSGDKQGWVAAILLSKTPPLSKNSLFDKLKESNTENKSNNVRTRASVQATAAATRGLRARTNSSNTLDQKNYQRVLAVESQQVTTEDAWNFHEELSQLK